MNQRSKEFLKVMSRFKKLSHGFKLKGCQISGGEFMILTHIEACIKKDSKTKELGVNVSKLSMLSEASKPATSKMLNQLENKNLIERISDKKDRRVVFVRLTPEGIDTLKQVKHQMDDRLDKIILKLGESDTKELIRILDKLYIIAEEFYNENN